MAEGAAIGVVVFVFVRLGYPEWITAVALLAGLHFFPLALLFGVYYATGFLLCGISVLAVGIALNSTRDAFLAVLPGIGSAFVLWGTAGLLIACGLKKRRASTR